MEYLPLWKKTEDTSDLYEDIFIAGENDELISSFCTRLDEFMEQESNLSEKMKADFIIDFDHELTKIRQLRIDSVSKFMHDTLVDKLEQFRRRFASNKCH